MLDDVLARCLLFLLNSRFVVAPCCNIIHGPDKKQLRGKGPLCEHVGPRVLEMLIDSLAIDG